MNEKYCRLCGGKEPKARLGWMKFAGFEVCMDCYQIIKEIAIDVRDRRVPE